MRDPIFRSAAADERRLSAAIGERVTGLRPSPPTIILVVMSVAAHRAAIREIFLRPRNQYAAHDAARLLHLTVTELFSWTDSGCLAVRGRRSLVSWQELASAATLRWTVMQIHDALGDDADRILPRLLRPIELKFLRLPEYLVRLLERLAANEGVTAEEYLYATMLELEVARDPGVLESLLPGFIEATRFPMSSLARKR